MAKPRLQNVGYFRNGSRLRDFPSASPTIDPARLSLIWCMVTGLIHTDKEEARYQTLEQRRERRKQVIRLHRQGLV
jgi:hypothetical protein